MREPKFRNLQIVPDEPGRFVGGIILAALVLPILYCFALRATGHSHYRLRFIALGLYFFLVGSVFLASYYFSHKSFIFRWFLWFL